MYAVARFLIGNGEYRWLVRSKSVSSSLGCSSSAAALQRRKIARTKVRAARHVPARPPMLRPSQDENWRMCYKALLLLEHLSAFDNTALPLRIRGGRPAEYRTDVAELLAWVGLGSRMHAQPSTLAGGEKQRLAIARAVVNRPDILLADEPTGNVDQEMALRIYRLFVELNRLGTTVLIATHDQDLVARSSRPALQLDGGRLTLRPPQGPVT